MQEDLYYTNLTVAGELAKLRHNILNMLDQKIAIMMAMILAY